MASKVVLVTGSEGFLGSETCAQLEEAGFKVKRFSHSLGNHIENAGEVEKAVKGCDFVVHLAALIDENTPLQGFVEVNVEGTRNVVTACKLWKVKKLVLASTIGVWGKYEGKRSENDPYKPDTNYEKTKVESEKIVKAGGIPFVIARFPIMYGPNKIWAKSLKVVAKGFPLIGKGNNKYHVIFVKDAASALVFALKGKFSDEIFNAANLKPSSMDEFFGFARKYQGLSYKYFHVPVWVALAGATLMNWIAKLKGKGNASINPENIRRITSSREMDISKILRAGWRPEYNVETGLRETVQELQRQKRL